MFLKKLTARSAIWAFPSSPRSLVPTGTPRGGGRRDGFKTPTAPRSQSFSGLPRNTLRVLGDLGVSIVSAISRPRCGVEEAEDAETDSNAERAEVAAGASGRHRAAKRPREDRARARATASRV